MKPAVILVAMATMMMMMIPGGTAVPVPVPSALSPLSFCDFHFTGHASMAPILDLQNPGPTALSLSIVSRAGQVVVTGTIGEQCEFPGAENEKLDELTKLCGQRFAMVADRLTVTTAAGNNATQQHLKGRQVLLPLTAVDMADGTQLRPQDGNAEFPERRRCVAFVTSTDVQSLLARLLNRAHRKKLAKISTSAHRVRSDFNSLLNSILQFAQ